MQGGFVKMAPFQDGCIMGFCNNTMVEDDVDLEPLPLLQHPQHNTHGMDDLHRLFTSRFLGRNRDDEPRRPVQQRTSNATEEVTDSVDSLLANALNLMSLQEREKALEDVHGIVRNQRGTSNSADGRKPQQLQKKKKQIMAVEPIDDLDPNYVNSCLLELETLLATMMRNNRHNNISTAYAQAAELSPVYVQQRQFRTMFLQAEEFDAQRTADRLVRFFELKKRLFGVEKLVQDITLDDLDENDMETLRAGGDGIVSSLLDSAGRPILCFVQKLRKYQVIENVHRALFYVFMSVMESPAAQSKGIVCIYYVVNHRSPKSVNTELRTSLPINVASYHMCTDHDMTYYAAMAVGALSLYHRARTRYHLGSHVECLYELMSFGISRAALPMQSDGTCIVEGHLLWIEQRRELEAGRREHQKSLKQQEQSQQADDGQLLSNPFVPFPASPSVVSCTTGTGSSADTTEVLLDSDVRPNDVLLGRGKFLADHPGNIKFRGLVDMMMSKYEESNKTQKTLIAEMIVKLVHKSSGRFLASKKAASTNAGNNNDISSHGTIWEEVTHATARNKVAHLFRNRRPLHAGTLSKPKQVT